MPAERHEGDFFDIDYTEIELRVLAFMTDNGPERRQLADKRERRINAAMTLSEVYGSGR